MLGSILLLGLYIACPVICLACSIYASMTKPEPKTDDALQVFVYGVNRDGTRTSYSKHGKVIHSGDVSPVTIKQQYIEKYGKCRFCDCYTR